MLTDLRRCWSLDMLLGLGGVVGIGHGRRVLSVGVFDGRDRTLTSVGL